MSYKKVHRRLLFSGHSVYSVWLLRVFALVTTTTKQVPRYTRYRGTFSR